jgi:hypothetical protein
MLNRNTGMKYCRSKHFLKNWIKNSSILFQIKKHGRIKKTKLKIPVLEDLINLVNGPKMVPRRKMMQDIEKLKSNSFLCLLVSKIKKKK